MKHIAMVAVGVLWLAACSSVTPVTSAGKDNYIVGSKKRVEQANWMDVKAAAVGRAVDFCNKQGKDMDEAGAQTLETPGQVPQVVKVTFRCVARP